MHVPPLGAGRVGLSSGPKGLRHDSKPCDFFGRDVRGARGRDGGGVNAILPYDDRGVRSADGDAFFTTFGREEGVRGVRGVKGAVLSLDCLIGVSGCWE